ncbi:amidohydrolase family protein [Candidatus Darwinibacter acetoxidans]
MSSLWRIIYEQVERLPVIDTHEHLPHHDIRCSEAGGPDVLFDYLLHYLSSDLRSAGLPAGDLERARDRSLPVEERWEFVALYWEFCRHTGYGRALELAARGIYGLDGLSRETISQLARAYRERGGRGHLRFVLRELCRIETAILDSWAIQEPYDRELFRYAWQPTPFILADQTMLRGLEGEGASIRDLDDWLQALVAALEDALSRGLAALKNAMAYDRTLYYGRVPYATAKALFAETLVKWRRAEEGEDVSVLLPQPVQDFLMHFVLGEASRRGLVLQVHTGLFEGSGAVLANGRPTLLNNLFLDYPNVKFDLLHMGYPYQGEAAALAKMFPNVYLDMCWAHVISPAAARSALADWLDAVPFNKIMGFGGDYAFVDGVYGHLIMAKENISRVLAEKVELGVFDLERAVQIAEHLLYINPKELFGL